MIEYRIDVIEELSKHGINTYTAKKTGIFGQETMKKFKNRDTSISLDNLNRLCCILEMQPKDIIGYVDTETEKEERFLSRFKMYQQVYRKANTSVLEGDNH